jgi:hypothetical protein
MASEKETFIKRIYSFKFENVKREWNVVVVLGRKFIAVLRLKIKEGLHEAQGTFAISNGNDILQLCAR